MGQWLLYDPKDKYYQFMIKDYYAQRTVNTYDFAEINTEFEKAVIII